MELRDFIELGYRHFGTKAMKFWEQFVVGEIDWDACCDLMSEAYVEHIMTDVEITNNQTKDD